MTEILTESFCERCGTRYTFEAKRPRVRLKGVKVLSRGLRNFVLSDDTSIDEAMAAARSQAERETTAHQLDAFHKTFNFCLSCRQYTCPNCWNAAEARCLSCAPLATTPAIEPEQFEAPAATSAISGSPVEVAVEAEPGPWSGAVEPGAVEPAPGLAAEPAPGTGPRDSFGKATGQTAGLLQRFRPGQNLDAELEAFERSRVESVMTEPAPEAEVAAEPEAAAAEPEAIAEPEAAAVEPEAIEATAGVTPDAIEAEAEIESIAAEAEAQPVEVEAAVEPEAAVEHAASAEPIAAEVETEAEPIAAEPEAGAQAAVQPSDEGPGADLVEQPTWRPAITERPTSPEPTPATVHDTATPVQGSATSVDLSTRSEPQWPPNPQWPPGAAPAAGLPFLGRPATPQGGIEALWAASNQELVASPPTPGRTNAGIRPCVSCGLSLSATARFCRRCGKLQAG